MRRCQGGRQRTCKHSQLDVTSRICRGILFINLKTFAALEIQNNLKERDPDFGDEGRIDGVGSSHRCDEDEGGWRCAAHALEQKSSDQCSARTFCRRASNE